MNDTLKGYLAVIGAILWFGSFAVPLKTKRVQEAQVDPVIFQTYYSLSIFASSWLVLTYVPFVFTPYAIASAALWVPASILSIGAINNLGMSIAVGIWAGTTVVISFLWGAIAFPHDHPVKNLPLSIVALFLIILGIAGLSFSDTKYIKGSKNVEYHKINETPPPLPGQEPLIKKEDDKKKKRPLLGIMFALILGCLNGSMMVPLRFVPAHASGINFIASFGIGVLVVTPVCALVYFLIRRQKPEFHVKVAMIPGLITGLIWNVGNYCSIYATLYLGLTVGFPLTQVALVVSGLWGIIAFREISGVRTLLFWTLSVAILLGGAAMLSLFG